MKTNPNPVDLDGVPVNDAGYAADRGWDLGKGEQGYQTWAHRQSVARGPDRDRAEPTGGALLRVQVGEESPARTHRPPSRRFDRKG